MVLVLPSWWMLEPHHMVTGNPSLVAVLAIHLVVPAALAIVALLRASRDRRRAEAADGQGTEATLAPGEATLRGAVEWAPGRDLALRVEIDQSAREFKGKNGVHHMWTENTRRVTCAPFYVHDPRGRVRVVPDERTLLVDAITRTEREVAGIRTRIAEVTADEKVHVVGVLSRERDPDAGGYRDGEMTLVMKAPPGGRLLVSTEPLGQRFRDQAVTQRFVALLFAVYIGVFALVDLGYYARLLLGHSELGTVTTFKSHGGKSARCELSINLANGSSVEVDVEPGACSRTPRGAKVPVYVVGSSWFSHVGTEPAVHVAAIVVGAFALVFGIALRRVRPWYEGKLVEHAMGKASSK